MKIEPKMDRVLVRRTKGKEMTEGGIIVPESAREKMGEGVVEAVGPGRPRPAFYFVDASNLAVDEGLRLVAGLRKELLTADRVIPLDVKMGDTVLFAIHAGTPLSMDGQDYVLLREEDVLAVVTGEADITLGAPTSAEA